MHAIEIRSKKDSQVLVTVSVLFRMNNLTTELKHKSGNPFIHTYHTLCMYISDTTVTVVNVHIMFLYTMSCKLENH